MTGTQSKKYEPIPYVEQLENYTQGGFHPVHLGDRLNGDRYRVLNKIGHGSFCTVWLAEDTTTQTCVAVSIQRAGDLQGYDRTHNVSILRHLSQGDPAQPGRSNVLLPLDIFKLSGVNGEHFCVVTPVQGQSLSMVIKRKLGLCAEVLPLSKARLAALDTIKAFAYIHKQNIVHGDLHPGNLLLSLSGAEQWSVERLEAVYGSPRTIPIKRIDGLPLDDCVPRYAVEEALGRLSNISLYTGVIKLADFGCAFSADKPPSEIDFFGPYIVPEQYCTGQIGLPLDIWTLGCAIYLLLAGRDLFGIPDDSTGMVLSKMTDMLGEPPEYILRSWHTRVSKDLQVSKTPSRPLAVRVQEMRDGNEALRMRDRRHEFSDVDLTLLTDFLGSMLKYEWSERLTIEEVLQHPCMAFFEADS